MDERKDERSSLSLSLSLWKRERERQRGGESKIEGD